MRLKDLSPREVFIAVMGWAITILLIKSGVSLWNRNYGLAVLYLALAAALAVVFFRKRKVLLTILALTFILVNASLTAVFHPSTLGILITVGSAAGLYLLARWQATRYPNLTAKDWKTLFDHDPGS